MRKSILTLSLLGLFGCGLGFGQERVARLETQPTPSLENVSPEAAADMWFYDQQWRRHDDPKQAVRRNAEFKAEQRRYRIAAMRWFGFSNSRPVASPIPCMGVYSPTWASTHEDPYRWVGGGYPTIAIRVRTTEGR